MRTPLTLILLATTFLAPPLNGRAQVSERPAAAASGTQVGISCSRSVDGPSAKVFDMAQSKQAAPAKAKHSSRERHARRAEPAGREIVSNDPTPTVQPETADCTRQAAQRYREIADKGGWPQIGRAIGPEARGEPVQTLRKRLAAEGDLAGDRTVEDRWDETLRNSVKAFQKRAGLAQSGLVDRSTLKALNVPAETRARQLEASADRLGKLKADLGKRYINVNIPAATIEAVEDGRVFERHAGIAGDPDHQSPEISATIKSVTVNPTWTIPRSIVEKEVIPNLQRSPGYLRAAQIEVLDKRHRPIDPRRINWSEADGSGLTFRQAAGAKNSLGRFRIDMPNKDAVYLHDTPSRQLFARDYRFLSHGCVRVQGVEELASWVLGEGGAKGDWSPGRLEEAVKADDTKSIPLKRPIPVVWAYLDAWADAAGIVHFRNDVYDLDGDRGREAADSRP